MPHPSLPYVTPANALCNTRHCFVSYPSLIISRPSLLYVTPVTGTSWGSLLGFRYAHEHEANVRGIGTYL
jgi:hypothetical protein